MFLIKADLTKEDDTLPKRMLEEPLPDGGGKGHVAELDKMLPDFYQVRGWDKTACPHPREIKK